LWKSVQQDRKRVINDHVPLKKMEKKVGFSFGRFFLKSFGKFRKVSEQKKSRTLKSKEEEPRYPTKKRKEKKRNQNAVLENGPHGARARNTARGVG
jgi:hypothetical protein